MDAKPLCSLVYYTGGCGKLFWRSSLEGCTARLLWLMLVDESSQGIHWVGRPSVGLRDAL